MTQTNSNLIEQFLADTLNHEQKKEFVKRLTGDPEDPERVVLTNHIML